MAEPMYRQITEDLRDADRVGQAQAGPAAGDRT